MTTTVSTLQNGIRVVTHHMAHVETTSLGVWVGVGARHETSAQNGISHLLEHMAFKGTLKRSALQIAEEIEQAGGDINAATSLENTAYYARVLKGDEGLALDILADILQNSAFDEGELARERDVILQEIAATQDSPEEIAYDLVQEAAFPGQAVGRAILGTPETVKAATPSDLKTFLSERYGPEALVISAAGAVTHDEIERHANALFGGLSPRLHRPDWSGEAARYCGGARHSERSFEQAHVLVGFEGPSFRSEDAYTAQVLSGLLGGGMSSRLFQEVREKRGLAYSIYSSAWGLQDSGMFQIHAATSASMVKELVGVVSIVLAKVANDGPTAQEIQRSKAQLKAGLLMSLESSSARADQMARQLLGHGRLISSEELIAKVDAVSGERVRDFARTMTQGPCSVAVVGAGRKSAAHARFAAETLARDRLSVLAESA